MLCHCQCNTRCVWLVWMVWGDTCVVGECTICVPSFCWVPPNLPGACAFSRNPMPQTEVLQHRIVAVGPQTVRISSGRSDSTTLKPARKIAQGSTAASDGGMPPHLRAAGGSAHSKSQSTDRLQVRIRIQTSQPAEACWRFKSLHHAHAKLHGSPSKRSSYVRSRRCVLRPSQDLTSVLGLPGVAGKLMAAEEAELDSTSKLIPSGAHPFADVIATADGASCEEGTALPGAISRSAGGLAAPGLEATGEVTDDVFPFREPSPRTVSLPPLQRMLRAKGGVQHSPQPSPRQRPATSTGSPTQLQQPRLALSDSFDGARAGSAASTLTGLPGPTGAAQSAQPPPVQGGRSGGSSSIAGDHADPARSVNAAELRLSGSRSSSQGHRHVAPDSSATALGFGRPCDSAPAAGDDESFLHQSRGRFQGSEGQAPAADEGRGAAEAARELEAQLKRLQVSRLSGLSRSLLCAGFEATRPVPARFRSRACLQSLSLGACMPQPPC